MGSTQNAQANEIETGCYEQRRLERTENPPFPVVYLYVNLPVDVAITNLFLTTALIFGTF